MAEAFGLHRLGLPLSNVRLDLLAYQIKHVRYLLVKFPRRQSPCICPILHLLGAKVGSVIHARCLQLQRHVMEAETRFAA